MKRSRPTLVFKHPTLFPPTLYFLSVHTPHPFMFQAFFLYLLLPLPPLTPSEFFSGMAEVFESGALNYYTSSRFIPWILSASRNPTSTHLALSGFLDTLHSDLIAPTPGLAFFLAMTRTLAVASSFLSGRAYPSLNFLPPLFICLNLTLIM